MDVEVLVEDRSGAIIVKALLSLRPDADRHAFRIRPHRGKGESPREPEHRPVRMSSGLLDLLPAKLRAYAGVLDPVSSAVVILLDADAQDPESLRSELVRLCGQFAPGLRCIVAPAVEEIEAWILGDPEAILAAFPAADRTALAAYRQDSVCGTWEWLARVLIGEDADDLVRFGYPEVGRMKREWAEAVSPHFDPDRNRSPSLRRFFDELSLVLRSES